MGLTDDTQRHIQTRLDFSVELTGEAREARRGETESSGATGGDERPARTDRLMEEVCERDNLKEALRRVQANKVVFIPLVSIAGDVSSTGGIFERAKMMVYLVAFQNGFFWKHFFDQRRHHHNGGPS